MMSSDKKKLFVIALVGAICSPFKFNTFFQQFFKVLTAFQHAFSTAKNSLDIFIFIVKFSLNIIDNLNKLLISTMGCCNIKLS